MQKTDQRMGKRSLPGRGQISRSYRKQADRPSKYGAYVKFLHKLKENSYSLISNGNPLKEIHLLALGAVLLEQPLDDYKNLFVSWSYEEHKEPGDKDEKCAKEPDLAVTG